MLELVPVNDLDISELGLALIRWCQANDYDAPHTFSKGGSFTPEMAVEWLVWQTKEEPYPTWTLLREELGFGPGGAKLIHEHRPGQWRLTALAYMTKRRKYYR